MEDFICESFIEWVEGIGLHQIAEKMHKIAAMENFSMAYLSFLSLADFFPQERIADLQKELVMWEKRQAWEKYKEQGDFWLRRGEGERAFGFYERALSYSENVTLLNNTGLALMHMGEPYTATKHFERAADIEPDNLQLRFNHTEALIAADLHDDALKIIAGLPQQHPEIMYFKGEIAYRQKHYFEAMHLFKMAAETAYDVDYIYRLSDCYMKTRQFALAIETLEAIPDDERDLYFQQKLAGHHAESGNIPAAIKAIEKALMADAASADLWISLAGFYRMDYNLIRAAGAISKALSLSPENPNALLEQARIRKAEGRTKEYQGILRRILDKFKENFRKGGL
ncbi:MAG: tetratricopeptide repeat protein [Defluviitaleaceae bacterium]|nr:tetratricopeptide repeat protein [Defluviitaleaceae bacterium]